MKIERFVRPDELGEDYLTSKEAADLCGVKLGTIRQWRARGYLTPVAVAGGRPYTYVFERSAVVECNQERTRRMGVRTT